ncbi:hypothetical protein DL89DRAFT_271353 [Linderina pennispora]|uniref:F-box domain-containing protein n=1 Tax=Linderina pennispora TaxID=61395 RepID=A0A1Y1VVX8_9FUNG|nr:uncharacterized protein DL89DRAFT_271353 [Linderina pennispora]ORX65146.1 hypothetical protein DL89DRAFT_271353 [Linderina pennispora]
MNHNWYSNIPECLRAGKAEETRCLQIVMRDAVQCPLGLLEILQQLQFDLAVWNSVETIEVYGLGFFAGSTLQSPDEQRAMIRDTCLFFRTHLPNVRSLMFRELTGEWAARDADGDMIFEPLGLYSELQLQYLAQATDVELMPPFPEGDYPALGDNTRNLIMHFNVLDPRTPVTVLPLRAENQESLIITDIDEDLTWEKFDPDMTGVVNFSNLTSLDLSFSAELEGLVPYLLQDVEVHFPRLRDLSVKDSTQIYTDFYTLFGSPVLSTVRIAEDYRELHRVSTNVILHAKSVTIVAGIPYGHRPAKPIKEEVAHLLTADSDVEELYFIGARYAVPEDIRLFNLRIFYITLHTVTIDDIVDILWMLPRLQHLRIWCNSMSHMDASIYPINIQRAMPAAVQRFIMPAITPKTTTIASTSIVWTNYPSASNNSYSRLLPIRGRHIDTSTGPVYPIPPSCELLKFELLSEKFFDRIAIRDFVDCVPTLFSVTVNDAHHEELARHFAGRRGIEICSFAPALR